MKKFISVLLCVVMIITAFAACSSTDGEKNNASTDDGKLSIVTTIFPEYDWVRQILGDKASEAELTMLLDNGVDLHSYQPTADDIMKISTCDMFIYVGGESDEWVDDALKEAVNKDMVVINLLDVLADNLKEEEVVEGMQAEEEEGEEEHDGEEGPEYDEHVWLSLINAKEICTYIGEKLGDIDKENAEQYKLNAKNYVIELDKLDEEYQSVIANAPTKVLLFADRFPFRYMTENYSLNYYAAFVGCSAETEASFETIKFLAEKVDELGLKSVITIEGTQHKIAQTIVANTKDKNQSILSLDSLQSTTSQDVENGVTYAGVMEKNLEVLKQALS